MLAQHHAGEIHQRAAAGDQAFFASQFAPLQGFASTEHGLPVIMVVQVEPVTRLDADHAVIVPGENGPRVFGTETGTAAMTGAPIHFFVEFDPNAPVPSARVGNFGNIVISPGAPPEAVIKILADKAFSIIAKGSGAAPPHAAAVKTATDPIRRATEALMRGDMLGAAAELERGAREREAGGDTGSAASMYRELAQLRRDMRDPQGALEACDRALAIVPPSLNYEAFVVRAGALDDQDNPLSVEAWRDAARWATSDLDKLVCEAHAIGGTVRHDAKKSELPKDYVAMLGSPPPPMTLTTVLGAIGQSAGKLGTGYLAQAAWIVFNVDGMMTVTAVDLLDALVRRVGETSEDGYTVAALIMLRLAAKGPMEPTAAPAAIAVVDRIAKARKLTREGLMQVLARDDNPFVKIDFALRSLAARTPWLIPG